MTEQTSIAGIDTEPSGLEPGREVARVALELRAVERDPLRRLEMAIDRVSREHGGRGWRAQCE